MHHIIISPPVISTGKSGQNNRGNSRIGHNFTQGRSFYNENIHRNVCRATMLNQFVFSILSSNSKGKLEGRNMLLVAHYFAQIRVKLFSIPILN